MVLGVPTLLPLFDAQHYQDLEGGVLESLGRLFKGPVKLYIYPWKNNRTGELVTADTFQMPVHLRHLYAHLLENHFIEPIREFNELDLAILPRDVLAELQAGRSVWEQLVPPQVVAVIKQRGYFGYRQPAA